MTVTTIYAIKRFRHYFQRFQTSVRTNTNRKMLYRLSYFVMQFELSRTLAYLSIFREVDSDFNFLWLKGKNSLRLYLTQTKVCHKLFQKIHARLFVVGFWQAWSKIGENCTNISEWLTQSLLYTFLHQTKDLSYCFIPGTELFANHKNIPCRRQQKPRHIAALRNKASTISVSHRLSLQKSLLQLTDIASPVVAQEAGPQSKQHCSQRHRFYRRMNSI